MRRRVLAALTAATLAACGGAPARPAAPAPPAPAAGAPSPPAAPDPDLAGAPPAPLLAIAWDRVPLAAEADAHAVWAQIAPTGDDWEAKLAEIPVAASRPLAIALLRAGSFACAPARPAAPCAPPVLDVDPPAPGAGLTDPCLRRLLALWAVVQLEPEDLPRVWDALRAIVALPPPESELIAPAIEAVPEDDHARRLELMALAHRAGHRELANGYVGRLDEAHALAALTTHHMEGPLDVLDATEHRAAYLAAIADPALAAPARARAIAELVAAADQAAPLEGERRARDVLGAELRAALQAATRADDCLVAATAARALELRGDRRFVPRPPARRTPATMMRALCVLASYERLLDPDEPSRLPAFLPTRGLEIATVTYDPLSDVDADGDGDPTTTRDLVLAPRDEAALPELEDLIRALRRCTGATCASAERDFRFTFGRAGGQLALTRIEVAERPACPRGPLP